MNKNVVIIGAGGHAKVIADIIIKNGDNVYGFLDDNIEKGTIIIKEKNIKIIGDLNLRLSLPITHPELKYIVAIGNNNRRKEVTENMINNVFYTAIHPTAIIGMDVNIGEGTAIMAGTCINSNTSIGNHCIINTGAIVEHDNIIEDYVHISPNATLCGFVKIGKYVQVGAGAMIRNCVSVIHNCLIGMGATVIKDISEEGTYVGVPASKIRR